MNWDTVVIGSGAGGLAAALALARAGQRVLVLEQHYLPGGWCHSFSLEGNRFSPGVHYLGELGPQGALRRVYEGLGLGPDLSFRELNPDGYDHYLIGGERFDVPAGRQKYLARLFSRFPLERKGIERYFEVLLGVRDELVLCGDSLEFPAMLTIPFRAPNVTRWGLRTLGALLDKTIRDPMLRAILAANAGNHGLPPARASLPVHAAMVGHYLDGAWYPVGGAKRMPQAFIKALRKRGGAIRMSTRVKRILTDRGRVSGVELSDGERIAARQVVSNADPALTYGTMLEHPSAARLARKARRAEYSVSLVSLFCAVDMDLPAMGIDSGNYWWFGSSDIDGIYERIGRAVPEGELEALFLAVSSLKDPSPGERHHVIEMFTFAPYAAFAQWAGSESGERGAAYEAMKQALAARMLSAADRIVPGLSRHVVFRSVGTPLTNDFYCATTRGAAYGTAKTPFQVGPFGFGVRGPVDGLFCCGSSTLGHGVAGATASGLMAAQQVLGARTIDELLGPADGSLTVLPAAPARGLIGPVGERSRSVHDLSL